MAPSSHLRWAGLGVVPSRHLHTRSIYQPVHTTGSKNEIKGYDLGVTRLGQLPKRCAKGY